MTGTERRMIDRVVGVFTGLIYLNLLWLVADARSVRRVR